MSAEHEKRPWGGYTVLDDSPTHKVKRIEVEPGQRLSYQRHSRRAEHWFIVSGSADVTVEGSVRRLAAGDAVDIPRGGAHRIANAGTDGLVFVEVQHGEYFGEDDIERLEDDFGRASGPQPAGDGPRPRGADDRRVVPAGPVDAAAEPADVAAEGVHGETGE
jgi:mannose-6-phosphate isomerase